MDKKLEKANTIGERLYILRENHKMSQDELAEALNVSRQTISNWENDKVKLDVVKAAEICRLYDISMDELFLGRESGADEAQPPKRNGTKTIVMIIALVLSALLVVVGIVCLVTSTSNEVSSTIFIGESAVWFVAVFAGIAACGILMYLFFKKK